MEIVEQLYISLFIYLLDSVWKDLFEYIMLYEH